MQCKSLKTKLGPNLVRELEGSFRQLPPVVVNSTDSNDNAGGGGKLGILVSTREATKGVRDAMARSAYPLMWMMVERNGALQQALWNAKVGELGLGALGVEMQYGAGSDSTTKRNIALTWDGEEIPDMDQVQRDMAALESRWLALWEKKNSSCSSMPESSKLELLDLVEKLFPEEKPLFTTTGVTGTCSTLSEEDREKVLRHLSTRLQPAQTEGI